MRRRSVFRKPSLKASFKARTTGRAKRVVKRAIIPGYGKKGTGFIKNPKRSMYNAVYHRTSIDTLKPIKNKKRTTQGQGSQQSSSSCLWWIFWIVILILCLANIHITLGILLVCGVVWLLVKLFKKHDKITSSNTVNVDQNDVPNTSKLPTAKPVVHEGNLVAGNKSYNINPKILPLLYFTDGQLKNIDSEVGEPSAISINFPVAEGQFQKLNYYPSYSELTPEQRDGFLSWLSTDLSNIPDIGFAFLLLYCLERHILHDEYLEESLKIISKLQSQINNGSFDYYSSTSIGYIFFIHKRLDLLKYVDLNKCDIKLQILLSHRLSADQLIALASKVDFRNQHYIKEYPELFKKALVENLKRNFGSEYFEYELSNIQKLKKEPYMFSNYSLRKGNNRPDLLMPDPLSDRKLCHDIYTELQKAHDQVKGFLEIKRAVESKKDKSKKKIAKPKRINSKTGYPMSTDKQIRNATEQLKLTRKFLKINRISSYSSRSSQEKMEDLVWNNSAEKMDSADLEYKKGEWDKAEKLWLTCVAINYRAANRLRIMYQKEHRFNDAVQIIDFAVDSPVLRKINNDSYISDFKKKLETAEQKSMKHENEDQSKLSEEDLKKLNRDSDYWFKKIETVKFYV
ncbi:TerB N-terminal domain-containing protein [Lactobacillus amylovorus]|uniref:TerB N-terminal domain-containing protein n=1 Tax=Lactobacillus amylovorus TaxID=1604 RepID=UPI00232F3863|nr:TerB N-terminal domain-containing protein [Lactobacillus amylovorus]MDB6252168.1 TerB N-terminal domain-containing protein [Lactobacillus amylovorus]MDB6270687.1 TerB N-terminal domain-containing protein [Lactobacillus amylovorus]